MQKKVLQLIHGFTMGGAETLVKEYCLKLNKEKYDVSVLCFFKYHTPYESILENAGIKVVYINDIQKPSCIHFILYGSVLQRIYKSLDGRKRGLQIMRHICD